MGQLLDHSMHSPDLVSLALLLPNYPDASIIRFAHAYGIDVIYAQGGAFKCADAPATTRDNILALARAGALQ